VQAACEVVGIAGTIVRDNIASGTALFGIRAGPSSIVSGNVVGNSDNAIVAGPDSIVSDNVVRTGGGGLFAGPSSRVSGNNVNSVEVGIGVGPGSTVSGNTAHRPDSSDETILVDCPSNVIGNTATGRLVLNGDGCTNIDNLVISP
jgi:hypothetical protein